MDKKCRLGELPAGAKVKIDGCWYVVKDQQENKTFLEQVGFCNSYEDYLCQIRFNDKPLKQFIDEDVLGKGKNGPEKMTADQLKAELERQEFIKEEAFEYFRRCNGNKCPAYIEYRFERAREKMEEIEKELRRRKMRKTLKRQALEDIVEMINHARGNIKGSPDDINILEMNS